MLYFLKSFFGYACYKNIFLFFGKGVLRDYNAIFRLFKLTAEREDKDAENYITRCKKAIKVSEI